MGCGTGPGRGRSVEARNGVSLAQDFGDAVGGQVDAARLRRANQRELHSFPLWKLRFRTRGGVDEHDAGPFGERCSAFGDNDAVADSGGDVHIHIMGCWVVGIKGGRGGWQMGRQRDGGGWAGCGCVGRGWSGGGGGGEMGKEVEILSRAYEPMPRHKMVTQSIQRKGGTHV